MRIFAGDVSDAYLARRAMVRGHAIVPPDQLAADSAGLRLLLR